MGSFPLQGHPYADLWNVLTWYLGRQKGLWRRDEGKVEKLSRIMQGAQGNHNGFLR